MDINIGSSNFHESRNRQYQITPSSQSTARIEGQETIKEWIAKGNTPEVIPMGIGSHLNDLQKANIQKNSSRKSKAKYSETFRVDHSHWK